MYEKYYTKLGGLTISEPSEKLVHYFKQNQIFSIQSDKMQIRDELNSTNDVMNQNEANRLMKCDRKFIPVLKLKIGYLYGWSKC